MANGSFNPTTRQEGSDASNNTAYRGCVSKSFQVTGILHIVAGALCVVLGISAIVLKAFASYLAIPLWSGLLLFMITGTIGVANYCKPKSTAIVTAYIVMSTISATFSFLMIIAYSIFSQNDDYNYWESFICHPLPRTQCESPSWSRILINGVLILIYVLEMACGVTSFSLALYKKCPCCRRGCKLCKDDPGNYNMVYYAANVGGMPMMAVPNNQCARPIYIPGGSSGTSSQPPQFMYLAPSPQTQSYVAMPAGTQQNQTIPQLPPPPQHQPSPQTTGTAQQPSESTPGQTGFIQVQAPGQMQPQMVPQPQSAPQSQPAGQQQSSLPTGQAGFIEVQAPGQMQPQMVPQPQSAPQSQPEGQQQSSLPTGQTGFIQVQAPGQMQPQMVTQPQPATQSQPAGLQQSRLPTGQTGFIQAPVLGQSQFIPQPAGVVQQPMGTPPGQMGFFQVQGPGGQIQMIPASAVYPQVMMVPGPQQLGPTLQPGTTPQPGTTQPSGTTPQPGTTQQPGTTPQPGNTQPSGPTQLPGPNPQQAEQSKAPSQPVEDQTKEEVHEPNEVPSGQVSSGQFSDQAALI